MKEEKKLKANALNSTQKTQFSEISKESIMLAKDDKSNSPRKSKQQLAQLKTKNFIQNASADELKCVLENTEIDSVAI